jgi:hypothetical protein
MQQELDFVSSIKYRSALRSFQLLSNGYQGPFCPGVKRPERECDYSPSRMVELYLHFHKRRHGVVPNKLRTGTTLASICITFSCYCMIARTSCFSSVQNIYSQLSFSSHCSLVLTSEVLIVHISQRIIQTRSSDVQFGLRSMSTLFLRAPPEFPHVRVGWHVEARRQSMKPGNFDISKQVWDSERALCCKRHDGEANTGMICTCVHVQAGCAHACLHRSGQLRHRSCCFVPHCDTVKSTGT